MGDMASKNNDRPVLSIKSLKPWLSEYTHTNAHAHTQPESHSLSPSDSASLSFSFPLSLTNMLETHKVMPYTCVVVAVAGQLL